MFYGLNSDRKSQLSGILTKPLNPRERGYRLKKTVFFYNFFPRPTLGPSASIIYYWIESILLLLINY